MTRQRDPDPGLPADELRELPPPRIAAPPGTEVVVEIDGVYGQLKSQMVGRRDERYVIIRTPLAPPGIASKLFKGNRLTVRYLEEGNACGFQSTILASVTEPEPLLFLASPALLEEKGLRAARRVDVHLPCLAAVRNRTVEGTIIDLGLSGCRCIVPTHLADGVLHLHMADPIVLEARTREGAVRLQGKLSHVTVLQTTAHIGIHFDRLNQASETLLVRFLVSQGVEL